MLEAIKSYLPSFISHYLSTEFELFLRQELAEKFKYNDVPEQWITFLNRIDQMLVSLDSPLCDLAGQLLLCDEAKLKEKMISYIRSERVYDPVNSEILYRPMAYYFSEESAKLLAEQIIEFHKKNIRLLFEVYQQEITKNLVN